MAAMSSASFASIPHSANHNFSIPSSHRCLVSIFTSLKLLSPAASCKFRRRSSRSAAVVLCMSTATEHILTSFRLDNSQQSATIYLGVFGVLLV